MKTLVTDLPPCLLIEPTVFGDSRGFFMESWHRERYASLGIGPDFAQSNLSRSEHSVLRGLHYQWPNPQGKLVSVLEGEVFDVAVDIRHGSPTFGRWTGVMLSAENRRQFWIPEGFAHGFAVTGKAPALFSYLCTAPYDPAADACLAWNDPDLAIDWPLQAPQLSAKDTRAPRLRNVAAAKLPHYPGAR